MASTGLLQVSSSSRLARLGDEKLVEFARGGCPEAAEILLKKYRSFVESKARSYYLAGAERDDVVQEGMIGLYKAIRDYRGNMFARFRSFAELCITRQMITAVKSATRNKHVPLNDYISFQHAVGTEDNDGCLMDMLADLRIDNPEQIVVQRGTMRALRHRVAEELSSLEYDVLLGYLEGSSYYEMAGELGCSSKAVDNALQRAKRKVGRMLCEMN